MIEFTNTHFHYRAQEPVLHGLSLRVQPGEVYGLIGANGSGKSTALACLLGLLHPTQGAARIGGCQMKDAAPWERARMAALLQDAPVDTALTLEEHEAWLSPWHPRWNGARLREMAARFQLPHGRRLGQLSGGQKRLAAAALTLASEAEVLILDEPAANLDPWSRRKLLEEISSLLADRPDTAMLYCTHLLADLERLGTKAGWIDAGRLAFELALEDLGARWRHITLIFDGAVPSGFALPGSLPTVIRGPVATGIATFASEVERDAYIAMAPGRIEASPVTLEEVFLHWRQHTEAGPPDAATSAFTPVPSFH